MTKKLILLLATCLLFTSCLFGCGDENKPTDDNPTTTEKVESTTKEDVATTEPTTAEPTTQEPTTEEPTTKYVYKGMEFAIESVNKDLFIDLVVEKGYRFKVNDFVDKNASDVVRGLRTLDLFKALFSEDINKIIEFENKYFEPGATVIEIAYSENVVIEYDGEKKLCFYLVEDNGEYAYFDVYDIN
ncbi:MAG: hypothetical protein UF228_11185 [Lachnospiraceae bacterium]|nr:hypothetical protein [Lachnospiraceae bacterium]